MVCLLAWGFAPSPRDVTGTARVKNRLTGDVVVWLDAPPDTPRRPSSAAVLDQRDLSFFPHVLAVQVGTRVKFPNSDRVFHNVFSFHDGAKFDLGLYPVGAVKYVPFDRPGLSRVFCNIHPQMAAYVMVLDTPFFAVTDDAGRFAIRDVPPGTYTYHAWRSGGLIVSGTLDTTADSPFEVEWR